MQITFGDVVANILTGGLYYGSILLSEETSSSDETGSGEAGPAPEEPEGGTGMGEGGPVQTSGRPRRRAGRVTAQSQADETRYFPWTISGDFLLNSESGQVWLIDKQNLELIPITKKLLSLETAAMAINLQKLKNIAVAKKESEIIQMPVRYRKTMAKHYNSLIRSINQELVANTRPVKPKK